MTTGQQDKTRETGQSGGISIAKLQEVLRRNGAGIVDSGITVEQRRRGMENTSFPVADDIVVEATNTAGMEAEWIVAPGADSSHIILYLHGGGYVMGSLATHRALAGEISRAAKAKLLLVDYRLAPENPYPAAVEDGVAAYKWLLDQGFSSDKLAIAGDSAGGGLTVATLIELRDKGVPLPGAAVCISPWSDLTCSGETYETRAKVDPMIQHPGISDMAGVYLQGADAKASTASPNYADLAGLPPLLIHVGDAEVLLGDSLALHEKAITDGVDSTLEVWDEMIHVWHAFHPMLYDGKKAIDRIGAYLQERWQDQ